MSVNETPGRTPMIEAERLSKFYGPFKAANDVSADAYLNKEIGFLDISKTIESVLDAVPTTNLDTLVSVVENDQISRQVAKSVIESRA